MEGTKVKIGDKVVGDGEPCFVIAEAGVNHNGDLSMAKRMIDAAKNAGVDAIKFQLFDPDKMVTPYAAKAGYQSDVEAETQLEMLRKLKLTENDVVELAKYAESKGLMFLCSAFDEESVDLLEEIGVPAYKIASSEITNHPLLEHVAAKRRPILLSTGMSTINEVKEALNVIQRRGNNQVILLHCISEYPASVESLNLKVINLLRQTFKLPVGFSDHSLEVLAPAIAVALGACVIEKHFTLSRSLKGPDHKASLEPHELREMVRLIRLTERMLGDGIKRVTHGEEQIKLLVRKSIVAKRDIPAGSLITRDMLAFKRPAIGLEPSKLQLLIGRKARRHIKRDEAITLNDVI
ncbi:MAG: N-acetylneuraminate synthase [Thermoprotei archaeon]|nr:MAG: N-acetylneuraminate synthase [Thermoprotei archaeon]